MFEENKKTASGTEAQTTPDAAPSEMLAPESTMAADTKQSEKTENIIKGIIGRCFKKESPQKKQGEKKKQEEKKNLKDKKKLVDNKEEEKKQEEKTYNFQKLTPVQDASIDTYAAALDFAFKNDDIRNIAITGTYGSGKSSVIETYENQHKELKFIHLSLAHFDNDDTQNINPETEERGKRTIEGQLLNQLIQQIPKEKIPETQFGIKQDRKKWHYWLSALSISLCVLFFFCFLRNEEIMDFILHMKTVWLKAFFLFILKPDHIVLRTISLLVPLTCVVYILLYYLAGKKFIHKLNVQGNEIELFCDNTKDSFFDKYLNEILYLFEHADADAVVFEDIDRFKNTFVFERLHHINTLLHERQKMNVHKSKKISRFFYLIRDDLFDNNINKDRTKFFDFIIPIVPVVDGNNSYDVLSTLLSKCKEIWDALDKRFLRRICVFIDDYRILKNIYNEFLIYKEKLSDDELDSNKLFAMIVYKNIFPHDFAELQFNRGFIHALFKNKNNLIRSYNKYWNDEIKRKEQECYECEKEKDKELYELKELDDKKMKEKQGTEKETWRNEYSRRKNIIVKEKEERKQEAESLKHLYEKNRLEYKYYYPMSELMSKARFGVTIDEIIKLDIGDEAFESIKSNHYYPLLTDILKKGLIDETYSDYISILYPNSLTINDKRFVRKVIRQEESNAQEYLYHLNDPEKIMECLEDTDFSNLAILNHDLVDYLLTKGHNKAIKIILQQMWYADKEDFIIDYLRYGKNKDKMIKLVVDSGSFGLFVAGKIRDLDTHWIIIYTALEKRLWNNHDPGSFTDYVGSQTACIDKYVFLLTNKDGEELTGGDIAESQENNTAGLSGSVIKTYDKEMVKERLYELDIKFRKLEYDDGKSVSQEFIEFVYQHNLYDINEENIKIMIEKGCKKALDNELLTKFMSFILKRENPFCEYMSKNMKYTMEVYLKMYNGKISDSSETVIDIINNKTISSEDRKKYITKLATKVDYLDQVENKGNQKLLIKSGAVKYKGDNILSYYKNYSLDDDLIEFINSDHSKLDFTEKNSNEDINRFKEDCVRQNVTLNI